LQVRLGEVELAAIVGSATFTIVRSTIVMKYATASTAKARQRWTGASTLAVFVMGVRAVIVSS